MGKKASDAGNRSRQWMWTTYLVSFGFVVLLGIRYFQNPELESISSDEFWRQSRIRSYNRTILHHNGSSHERSSLFPKIVHQTWKSKSVPPHQTLRWHAGCKSLNKEHEFKMFDDNDLMKFTLKYYPMYGTVLQALTGVYMADMARVILAFHFGGIYMDLDFYCHRPLSCLEHRATDYVARTMNVSISTLHNSGAHVLVVPREPLIHAVHIHHRSRVVIQDFYMATPKHPFLQWILDDAAVQFIQNNFTTTKGPLSYSIDNRLDAFYQRNSYSIRVSEDGQSSVAFSPACSSELAKSELIRPEDHVTNTTSISSSTSACAIIYEIGESVLHPLVDASNHHLREGCEKPLMGALDESSLGAFGSTIRDNPPYGASLSLHQQRTQQQLLAQACSRLTAGKYLHAFSSKGDNAAARNDATLGPSYASLQTVLVHMWTHSFLDWSFLRGFYDQGTHVNVERTLPAVHTCN